MCKNLVTGVSLTNKTQMFAMSFSRKNETNSDHVSSGSVDISMSLRMSFVTDAKRSNRMHYSFRLVPFLPFLSGNKCSQHVRKSYGRVSTNTLFCNNLNFIDKIQTNFFHFPFLTVTLNLIHISITTQYQ